MIKFLVYAISIIFLAALNIVMPKVFGTAPNFLFLLVIFYAFRKNDALFLWLAFFSGLLMDVYSGAFFGSYIISFLVIGFAVNYTTRSFFTADLSPEFASLIIAGSYILLVALLYVINSVAFRLGLSVFPLSPEYITSKIWIDIAFNLAAAVPIYYVTLLNDRLILKFEKQKNVL